MVCKVRITKLMVCRSIKEVIVWEVLQILISINNYLTKIIKIMQSFLILIYQILIKMDCLFIKHHIRIIHLLQITIPR